MDYQLTGHARESLRKRPSIRLEWVERVLLQPERVEPDPHRSRIGTSYESYSRFRGACVTGDRQENIQPGEGHYLLF